MNKQTHQKTVKLASFFSSLLIVFKRTTKIDNLKTCHQPLQITCRKFLMNRNRGPKSHNNATPRKHC